MDCARCQEKIIVGYPRTHLLFDGKRYHSQCLGYHEGAEVVRAEHDPTLAECPHSKIVRDSPYRCWACWAELAYTLRAEVEAFQQIWTKHHGNATALHLAMHDHMRLQRPGKEG